MKKLSYFLLCLILVLLLAGCKGMSISNSEYDEIKKYVENNIDKITVNSEVEFFTYETTGISIGGVYYGYYYTEKNEILTPDFYTGENLGKAETKDGGTYFGKPNNGTDWCFVKQITDNWFYYELHWA